ncbi:MAG: hypothetical protein J6X53_07825 [Abditibacteriota bacterium]|nr:hypothetical protein [Abditibacteriota bacterium]
MDKPDGKQTSYKEKKIGNTIYCITSVYNGEKDLKSALEELAIRSAMADHAMEND